MNHILERTKLIARGVVPVACICASWREARLGAHTLMHGALFEGSQECPCRWTGVPGSKLRCLRYPSATAKPDSSGPKAFRCIPLHALCERVMRTHLQKPNKGAPTKEVPLEELFWIASMMMTALEMCENRGRQYHPRCLSRLARRLGLPHRGPLGELGGGDRCLLSMHAPSIPPGYPRSSRLALSALAGCGGCSSAAQGRRIYATISLIAEMPAARSGQASTVETDTGPTHLQLQPDACWRSWMQTRHVPEAAGSWRGV
jgi:hypothetical protein